jgi:metal-dependent amidase/aminoacylase/carboxypeptidase family protein
MKRAVKGVCDSMGASCEISYASPYIPTVNDPAIVDLGKSIARRVLGPSGWAELEEPSMGGEDFAYYIANYPGAMFRIGMGKGSPPLHNAQFDFNDHALKNGILFLASAALEFLNRGSASN